MVTIRQEIIKMAIRKIKREAESTIKHNMGEDTLYSFYDGAMAVTDYTNALRMNELIEEIVYSQGYQSAQYEKYYENMTDRAFTMLHKAILKELPEAFFNTWVVLSASAIQAFDAGEDLGLQIKTIDGLYCPYEAKVVVKPNSIGVVTGKRNKIIYTVQFENYLASVLIRDGEFEIMS